MVCAHLVDDRSIRLRHQRVVCIHLIEYPALRSQSLVTMLVLPRIYFLSKKKRMKIKMP
jgi:hypothetical protein